MKDIPIKAGDLVERWQGGHNSGKKVGDTFIVHSVSGSTIYDDNKNTHDKVNIRLLTPKDPIINSYPIY